ncbi:6645_t:CDS:2 [Diversispora eburnea]|uniref:6645_t:CDS:1 n=1 Tax=Diversispora eburnea TaxID=1213867 RepID=A0A9N8VJA4_9GLOM|nr:6645_t:CDS:2 [Diversispora eburnea]
MGNSQSFRHKRHKRKLSISPFSSCFYSTVKEKESSICRDPFLEGLVNLLNDNYIYRIIGSATEKSQLLNELSFLSWKSYFSSPINTNLKLGGIEVLEYGCGSADWIMTMATLYPESKFTGVDSSQIFPTNCMPSNVSFVHIDTCKELPFENDQFDYIYVMDFFAFIPEKNIEQLNFPELVRILKPGGWLEICDCDGRAFKNMVSITLRNWGIRPLSAIEILLNCYEKHFDDFHSESKVLKTKEELVYSTFHHIISHIKRPLLEFTSINSEKFDETLANIKKEFRECDSSIELCRLYAQKSLNFMHEI